MDAGVWKVGYACMHLNDVRKPALGGNDFNSSICRRWYKLTMKYLVTRNALIFNALFSEQKI